MEKGRKKVKVTTSSQVQKTYLSLTLLITLATSLIYGINTLFLLDAGLTNAQAFGANAFFTLGQVIFEVPTGIVADVWGRRNSYLLGTVSLALSTLLYFLAWQTQSPFWVWALSSILIGLGFTFFSGATEAWLVDALDHTKFKGKLESVFAKNQMVGGVAMLIGSVGGGIIAQTTNLGVPYILRAVILGITFIVAFLFMKDLGFKPEKRKSISSQVKKVFSVSISKGLGFKPVRWIMLAAPFGAGVSFYAFYAMQPYLLELYGDSGAYSIAGIAAAVIGGAQVLGGVIVNYLRKVFKLRTSILIIGTILNTVLLLGIGLTSSFYIAVFLLILWGMVFAAIMPVRQTYLNKLIPSNQRATVLSFDSLVASTGGVGAQPILGKVADISNYSTSYFASSAIQILALPFLFLARKEKPKSDKIGK